MGSPVPTNAIESMFENLPRLRKYASRVILDGQALSPGEELDKTLRMRAFMRTGASLNWTDKEMVTLILREVFAHLEASY